MVQTAVTATEIPLGEFRLLTSRRDIQAAYEDDAEIDVEFDTGGKHLRIKAVFRLRSPEGFDGHATNPAGYTLQVFRQPSGGGLFMKVTQRKGI